MKRDRVVAVVCWFLALFLVLQGLRYLAADFGKVMLVVAVAFAIGGFRIWPRATGRLPGGST